MSSTTSSLGFGLETRRALAGLGVAFGILTLVLGVILLLVVIGQCSRREADEAEEAEEEEKEELRPIVIMGHKRD
jgi:Na+-transporting methylmalonyl-CoA/oxaloacetate decarboxylase gamma subunit